ncbi:MAG: GPW/gp25 family protein [Nitrospira sp.]|nr:GPW/gp25 family protein [Nitrospira sp.]
MNIDYPFHFDRVGRTATTGEADHIRDMIEEFLFTNPGERANRPDFGSGLLQMIFTPNSSELATALQFTVQAGLQRWLGDLIAVERLEVMNNDEGRLTILIQYLVRRTNERRTTQFLRKV